MWNNRSVLLSSQVSLQPVLRIADSTETLMDGTEVLTSQGQSETQFPQHTDKWTPQMFHCESWMYNYKENVKF